MLDDRADPNVALTVADSLRRDARVDVGVVVELVIPAVGVGDLDDVVKTVLRFAAEGGGADHAEGDLDETRYTLGFGVGW